MVILQDISFWKLSNLWMFLWLGGNSGLPVMYVEFLSNLEEEEEEEEGERLRDQL